MFLKKDDVEVRCVHIARRVLEARCFVKARRVLKQDVLSKQDVFLKQCVFAKQCVCSKQCLCSQYWFCRCLCECAGLYIWFKLESIKVNLKSKFQICVRYLCFTTL